MKKFVIERNLPGAENLSADELEELAHAFCDAASQLEKTYVWLQSFITGDKIYCLVLAENLEVIREHAKAARVPVNIISEVKTIIDPTARTSEPNEIQA